MNIHISDVNFNFQFSQKLNGHMKGKTRTTANKIMKMLMMCVSIPTSVRVNELVLYSLFTLASFPGPAQLSDEKLDGKLGGKLGGAWERGYVYPLNGRCTA